VIKDLFNDKLNYNILEYNDLVLINNKMLEVAEKYKMFGESEPVNTELSKFLQNFEMIQVELVQIEEKIQDTDSELKKLEAEVKNINERLSNFKNSKNIVGNFVKSEVTFSWGTQCYPSDERYSNRGYSIIPERNLQLLTCETQTDHQPKVFIYDEFKKLIKIGTPKESHEGNFITEFNISLLSGTKYFIIAELPIGSNFYYFRGSTDPKRIGPFLISSKSNMDTDNSFLINMKVVFN